MSESVGTGPHRPRPGWPTPGSVLGRGRYRLISELGRDDRYAIRLWRGRDLMLERDVALTLFLAAPHDPTTIALIRSAATRAFRAARLETAGAVRVLDVLEPEREQGPTVAVVVAEWTQGCALVDLLDSGPLPPPVAASVLSPLAGAVDAAHNAGLVLGCDHPDRIRMTPDRQARLAFPGPPPTTGPQDDIRGLGAMLYLLLTGCWPLPDGPRTLPPAPIGADGAPVSPSTLRPEVPVELSTLALRCLGGPGTGGAVRTGAAVQQVLELNTATVEDLFAPGGHGVRGGRGFRARPIDRRQAQRRRRIKFSVSMTVLAAATLMIIGYAGMQVISVFADTGGAPLVVAGNEPTSKAAAPPPPMLSAPARVKSLSIYDPSGKGNPDHQKDLSKLLDGNTKTWWSTDSYSQQFPAYKKGLGVMLRFEQPVTAAAVTVDSLSPGTVVEVRSAVSPTAQLDQTSLVGTATLSTGNTQIPLRAEQPTRYLLVWITTLGGSENRHQSKISELDVQQRST